MLACIGFVRFLSCLLSFGHLASMQTQVFQDGRAWLVGSTDGTVYDTLDNLISVLRSRFQRSKFQSSKTFVYGNFDIVFGGHFTASFSAMPPTRVMRSTQCPCLLDVDWGPLAIRLHDPSRLQAQAACGGRA